MPRGQPKKITPTYLEKVALFYLERYSSSAQNLRRVLDRKIRRSVEVHGTPSREEAAGWIVDLIAKLQRNRLLDDQAYAISRVRRLYAEGKSLSRIRQTLAVKGIGKDDVEAALARLKVESAAPVSDLPAAAAFARKRKLGPYRSDPTIRAEMRQKDLGALARRGFSQTVAMTVLNARDADDLIKMIEEES